MRDFAHLLGLALSPRAHYTALVAVVQLFAKEEGIRLEPVPIDPADISTGHGRPRKAAVEAEASLAYRRRVPVKRHKEPYRVGRWHTWLSSSSWGGRFGFSLTCIGRAAVRDQRLGIARPVVHWRHRRRFAA